ncbi:MAG: tRNA lysidine(34) synthetase TilS [Coriobacteriia bacterium]|nr:MAG: tRNA lysidine(34) synthetase TilS [Coriobacteriia bacterium]
MAQVQAKIPVLLMVSGGSDSTALLELVCTYVAGERSDEGLFAMLTDSLPAPDRIVPFVLHVNHMLRGEDSDGDERFVRELCEKLDVPCEVQRVDVGALARSRRGGMEAIAREERYRLASSALDRVCARVGAKDGLICTAHTIDDRVETFFMRALVGTGPGGLASIPRVRGNLRRPLLDASREQLRDWLRKRHPGVPDEELWREDETNLTGDNFRSQIRRELIPVLREFRPGFEGSLAQTMDLIADEDEALRCQADSIAYRTLVWDGETASMPVEALRSLSRSMARRVMRACLLVVNPDARLEAAQIDRVLDGFEDEGFTTETSGGLRVSVSGDALVIRKVQ